jgi:hypothetical protein
MATKRAEELINEALREVDAYFKTSKCYDRFVGTLGSF